MSGRQDSNLRPPGPKPDALPACATPRTLIDSLRYQFFLWPAVRAGFEPAVRGKTYDSLANYWIRPLSHLTYKRCKPLLTRYLRTYFPFLEGLQR